MKRQSFLALSLVALLGVTSCDNDSAVVTLPANDEVRTVNFLAHMEENVDVVSRTGVKLKVIHTWQNTDVANIHLFENSQEGTNVAIHTEEPWETASFSANFQTEAGSGYTYTGIIAQREDGNYIIPSIQYPTDVNTGTGIDPDADFIIGMAFENETTLDGKTINFEFKRPVAVSRFAITNIEGDYVKSVTITSNNELTGSASYSDIDFDNCTVSFTGGSNTLTMEFQNNALPVSSTTYVNFVSTLGAKEITKVEVVTDKYIYTKTKTATLTFDAKNFKNIAMDMTVKDGCTREENVVKKTYTKVIRPSQTIPDRYFEGGTYLIVDETASVAFAYDQSSNGYKTSVNISDNKIVSSELGKYEVTISLAGDGELDHYLIKTSNGKYFYRSSDNTSNFLNDSYTYDSNDYYAKIGDKGDFTLGTRYKEGPQYYFRYSSNAFGFTTSSSTIQLYKYEDPRTPQTLSFTDKSPEVDINDTKSYHQTVKGAHTTVTYSITSVSPSDAATINASTGELTLVKKGKVEVTATTNGDDQYRPAEASYTLIVKDRTVATTYTKVTAEPDPLDWSGTYLIVDESSKNIFAYDQTGYKKSVASCLSDDQIVSNDFKEYEVTINGIGNDHYDITTSAGKYLYYTGSGSILHESNKTTYTYYAKIGEEGMISLGTKRSGGTEYFMYYNSSKSAFEFIDNKNNIIQLYKLDESDEPASSKGTLTKVAEWDVSGVAYNNGDFSGLTFSADGKKMIAAFNSAALYWLDMPVEGQKLNFAPFEVSNASFRTTKRDIEAVTVNRNTGDIYYVQETDATGFSGRTLYKLAASSYNTEEKVFTFDNTTIPSGNNGAEGLTWIGDDNFIIGREGNNGSIKPMMIFYSCSKGVTKTITPAAEIKQIAEIVYDDDLSCLWILDGDYDKILYRCDMEGNALDRFPISQIANAEALLLDKANDCIWIGSDETTSKLYKFRFQQS